jgi:hypothetical protein
MAIRGILVLGAVLLVSSIGTAAPSYAGSQPVLAIRIQPLIGICAGICPDFDVTVIGDHRVELRIFDFEPKPRKVRIFAISAAKADAFRKELASLRPAGTVKKGVPCPIDEKFRELRYGASSYDIRWAGSGQSSRLLACYGEPVLDLAVTKALLDISLSRRGYPLTSKQVRAARACLLQKDTRLC